VADPFLDCKINVLGTLNLLEAALLNNVSNFIFAFSIVKDEIETTEEMIDKVRNIL